MTEANDDSALIRNAELFEGMPDDELDFVISRCGKIRLSRGDLLFSSGEEAKHFYILKNGVIRVYKPREDGGQDEMARFATGDAIGDFDFARGAAYDAFAEAAEDSELIKFPGCGFSMDSMAQEKPRTVCGILLKAIVMMTKRIKTTQKLILENMSWVKELHRRAYEDPGTGLWKQALIADEIIHALKNPSALIMLKPDHFKLFVDSRGHGPGDEALIRIALILKNTSRRAGNSWPMRFKSNEMGIIINNCDAGKAQKTAEELLSAVRAMEPAPAADGFPQFSFSAAISYAIWPADDADWENLFRENYASLFDAWRNGGDRIVHYSKAEKI
ncbi:MAG: diguanylate cyclase [Treponema sp.]|jgi:diguanylate cyclase (GGDEF)-like protein|nr:diguanylate cyclase [Treponema sp.]